MSSPTNTSAEETRKGMIYGILAYGSWGVLPIYFRALDDAGPMEILAQRILWSVFFCLIYWLWKRDLGWIRDIFRQPRKAGLLFIAAYVLAVNWGVYIYAVSIGNVLESSLGYFINPLMMVLVGVLVLKERMSPMQWTAIGLGAIAVLVISVDYGRLPWIALTLATSFTIYGVIKKQLGSNIGAVQTMTFESLMLAPFAIGVLVWIKAGADNLTFGNNGVLHTFLLIFLGLATILPLSLFTSAATRLPLVTMGMLQFLAPIGQFMVAVFVFGESVPLARWIGFGFVWAALILLTLDSFRRSHARRKSLRAQREASTAV